MAEAGSELDSSGAVAQEDDIVAAASHLTHAVVSVLDTDVGCKTYVE